MSRLVGALTFLIFAGAAFGQGVTTGGLPVCTELTSSDVLVVDDEGTTTCSLTGAALAGSTLLDLWVDETGDSMTGALTIAAAGNALAVDTDTFVVDATNDRLGIGVASPSRAIDFRVGSDNTGHMAFLDTSPAAGWLLGGGAGNSFFLSDIGDAVEFQLTGTGEGYFSAKLGVGDASPDAELEVVGGLQLSATAGGDGDRFVVNTSGNVGINVATPTYRLETVDKTAFGYVAVTSSSLGTSGDVLVVDADGEVGISTTSPAALLHVEDGDAGAVSALVDTVAIFETDANTKVVIWSPDTTSGNLVFGTPTDDISFEINAQGTSAGNKTRFVGVATDQDIWIEPERDTYFRIGTAGTDKVCIQTIGIGTICDYGLLATPPSTCTVGDTYTDTSPAKCWCSATNTWSVVVGTSCTSP